MLQLGQFGICGCDFLLSCCNLFVSRRDSRVSGRLIGCISLHVSGLLLSHGIQTCLDNLGQSQIVFIKVDRLGDDLVFLIATDPFKFHLESRYQNVRRVLFLAHAGEPYSVLNFGVTVDTDHENPVRGFNRQCVSGSERDYSLFLTLSPVAPNAGATATANAAKRHAVIAIRLLNIS